MNYSNLMEVVNARIRANGRREITGDVLNDVLRAMVVELGAGYQLGGTIRPGDKPKDEDLRVAYLAVEPGMYLYAGGFEVTELSLITYGAEWYMYPLGVPFGSQIAEDIAAAVEAEKARAMAAEKALSGEIDTETRERAAADSVLDSAIKAEAKRATDAEGVLTKAVADEKARAMSAERANASAIASEADTREQADTALQGNITAEESERKAADTALGTRVTSIEDKIPAQASSENKLADKDFVNSSIATSTATFRGTFDTLEALKAAQADKNDYAFWVHKDEDGNTCYDKYTYTGTEWKFEYRLNNSSFTAAQWAALNSGVTADVIKALQDADKANAKAIADEKAERIAAVEAEKTAREQADTANAEAITTETAERKAADQALQGNIDKKQDKLVSGTNIKTINGESVLGSGDLTAGVSSMSEGVGDGSEVFNYLDPANAAGDYSHAEGENTQANAEASHAEGDSSVANGYASHAEGNATNANGIASHAEGDGTTALSRNSHAEGSFNVPDGSAVHSVGIGERSGTGVAAKDAHRITYDGKHYILGIGGFDGTKATANLTNEKDLATVINEYETRIAALETALASIKSN